MGRATGLLFVGTTLFGGLGSIVSAFRTGSNSCDSGVSVGALSFGVHGTSGSGELAEGNYIVSLGGTELEDGTNIFTVGSALDLTLSGPSFKGFMIRLSSEDDSDNTGELTVEDSENTRNLDLCDALGVSGVTHPNRDPKTSITVGFEASGNRLLEVMVVRNNSPVGSNDWFGSAFSLTAVTNPPTSAPTSSPTPAPTSSPSSSPSSSPTSSPTSAPSSAPSSSPSSSPTSSPTSNPTSIPTSNPTLSPAPTLEPTMTPTILPSGKPSTMPSVMPSVMPSIVPSTTPSLLPSSIPSTSPIIEPSHVPSFVPTKIPTVAANSSGFMMQANMKRLISLLSSFWVLVHLFVL